LVHPRVLPKNTNIIVSIDFQELILNETFEITYTRKVKVI